MPGLSSAYGTLDMPVGALLLVVVHLVQLTRVRRCSPLTFVVKTPSWLSGPVSSDGKDFDDRRH